LVYKKEMSFVSSVIGGQPTSKDECEEDDQICLPGIAESKPDVSPRLDGEPPVFKFYLLLT
jgi:hypothetical protein